MADHAKLPSKYFIDETAIETRLARLVSGRLVELKLFPQVGPAVDRSRAGDVYLVRIAKVARAMNGAFVDLGVSGEGFLRTRDALAEGSFISAKVIQPGYRTKTPVLSPVRESNQTLGGERKAGLVAPAPSAVAEVLLRARPEDTVMIDGDKAWRELRGLSLPEGVHAENASIGLFERESVEAQIEMALEPVVTLPSGGRLIVEETEALTAIDVDVASGARAFDVNMQAAEETVYQIAAREISGNIVIDFAQVRRASDLAPINERIVTRAHAIGLELEMGAGARTGLMTIQRQRREAPLSARLTEAGITHTAVPVLLNLEAQTARLARFVRLASARRAGALDVRVNQVLGTWLSRHEGAAAWQAIRAVTPAPLHFTADADLSSGTIEVERSEKGAA